MATKLAVNALAIRVCRIVHDERQDHQSWISIDRVHDRLGIEDLRTVNAALAFAAAKGWVELGGSPSHSVMLNPNAP